MKRIIRLLFYIPILPLIIIHYVALPTHWFLEKTLDFIHEVMDKYSYGVRTKFPELMDRNVCAKYHIEACKGYNSNSCSYARIDGVTICPNDLKDGGS